MGQDTGTQPDFIVGIGSSAGGLAPLEEFFDAVVTPTKVAFVLVQHLSPDFDSLIGQLLSRHTSMAVVPIDDGTEMAPNTVYVIPPGANLFVEGNRLRLQRRVRENHAPNMPIDLFFESLAGEVGRRAIGVVLSGTGSDGSRGLAAVREMGGVVLVQDPKTAQFDGMPISAMGTGQVDFVQSPRELAVTIKRIVDELPLEGPADDFDLAAEPVSSILELAAAVSGIEFAGFKPGTILRRIERRRVAGNHPTLDEYLAHLRLQPEERMALANDLIINVTSFFRDPDAWRSLSNALRPVMAEAADRGSIRAWVTACSCGQEAYSFAIMLDELRTSLDLSLEIKIFATDVHQPSLDTAAAGVYPGTIAAELGAERLQRYFKREADGYRVVRRLREMVIFARQDLVKDAPFTRIDVTSCRNALIYMRPTFRSHTLRMLRFSLRAGGVLFLGAAEMPNIEPGSFEVIDQTNKIFRRLKGQHGLAPFAPFRRRPARPPRTFPRIGTITDQFVDGLSYYFLDREAVCLLVDSDGKLLHSLGATQSYLRVRSGLVSSQASEMVVEGLSVPVTTALHQCRREQAPVRYGGIELPDGEHTAHLEARIIDRSTGMVLVVLSRSASTVPGNTDADRAERETDLAATLQHTQAMLHAVVEELQASNEEAQATNEELLAANEELQSTNEELQSTNEELYTVNSELQAKIGELTQLNHDFDSVLESMQVGTVFLDDRLRIQRVMLSDKAVLSALTTDVGRPFSDLAHRLPGVDLNGKLAQVLDTGAPFQARFEVPDVGPILVRATRYSGGTSDAMQVVLGLIRLHDRADP